MILLPRVGAIAAVSLSLAVAVMLWLIPREALFARIAPERYLAGVGAYTGTANIHVIKDSSHIPLAILAWRRLLAARDIRAFARLAGQATPAGRLYGIAGLRALAPQTPVPEFLVSHSDSVVLNTSCRQRQLSFATAFLELDVPGWPDSLRQAPVECR